MLGLWELGISFGLPRHPLFVAFVQSWRQFLGYSCTVSGFRTELFRDASACPVSILDAYAFQRVLVAPTRASFDSSDRYRLLSGQQQVCGMDLGASAFLIWAPRSYMCALMLIQLVPVIVYEISWHVMHEF